jgi:hypothetical protein
MNPDKHPTLAASAAGLGIETVGDCIEFGSLGFGTAVVVEDCCCSETPGEYPRGNTLHRNHRNHRNCWMIGDYPMERLQQIDTSARSPV